MTKLLPPAKGFACPYCGGPLTVENFTEATFADGVCGYGWSNTFRSDTEPDIRPCRTVRAPKTWGPDHPSYDEMGQ